MPRPRYGRVTACNCMPYVFPLRVLRVNSCQFVFLYPRRKRLLKPAMPTQISPRKRPEDLRSHRWLGPDDLRSFGHRSRMKQMGYAAEDYAGKPVIAILNTWSDFNTCH